MNSATISVRRVVFGISGWGDAEEGLELALAMAKAMDLMVNCLLPERRDLLAAAGLPFARITSHGGLSSPVTRDDMAASLRRQQRQAEQSVTARCRSAGVSLSIDRPSGEYASGLLSSVMRSASLTSRRPCCGRSTPWSCPVLASRGRRLCCGWPMRRRALPASWRKTSPWRLACR